MSFSTLKKLGAATAILVVLWILYLYRQVPHAQSPFAKADAKAQSIVLTQGSRKIELQKKGNDWNVLTGTGMALAEDAQIASLLSGLKDVQVEDEISDRADRAAEYEVNVESGTRVQIFGEKNGALGDGLFGKQAPDYVHIYFRYPDKPNVYLARGLLRGELGKMEANSWRSRQLIAIPEAKIQTITIEGKGFKTELVRKSTDVWTLNGKIVEITPVNTLVGTLAHLRAIDFVDPAVSTGLTYEGLTNGRVTVKGTDSTVELRIGPLDAKLKRYPVSTAKEAGLAWLSEPLVQAIQEKPSSFTQKH